MPAVKSKGKLVKRRKTSEASEDKYSDDGEDDDVDEGTSRLAKPL